MQKMLTGVILLAILLPGASFAQAESSIGVFASFWDTDQGDEAWGGGAKVRAGIFEARATYYADVSADTNPKISGLDVSSIPIEVGLAYNFAPEFVFNPYVGAGVSYYFLDTDVGSIDDEFGWYAVVGGEFGMASGFSVLAELQYRWVEGSVSADAGDFEDTTITVGRNVDLDLSGIAVNLGVAWRY